MAAPEPSDSSDDATQSRRPRVDDTTGYGVAMTFVAGVLLALAYYGWLAIQGPYGLGQALPEPFYLLAIALLFVVELLNSRRAGLVVAIARAMAVAALYGALFVLAVEGGAYIMDDPAVFLENFVGVTVVAISLVAAALVYVTYLTVVEAS
ncbi:hypothetical protein ACFQMM_05565 [Saliphagus sp. GCM10025308]